MPVYLNFFFPDRSSMQTSRRSGMVTITSAYIFFFFFLPPPILPPVVSLPYLFLFFPNVKVPDSSRWPRLKKGSLSLSLFLASTITFPLNRHRLHPEFLNKIYKYADKSGSAFLFRTVCARSTSCKHTFSRTRACKRSLVSRIGAGGETKWKGMLWDPSFNGSKCQGPALEFIAPEAYKIRWV